MAKRTNVQISLKDWELPKLSNKIENLVDKTRSDIEKSLDKFVDNFYDKKIENLIKNTVSDFLKYSAKDRFMVDAFPFNGKTGDIKFHLSFSDYDYLDTTINIRDEINSLVYLYLHEDGFIDEKRRPFFIDLSKELKSLSMIIEKRIREKHDL